MLSPDFRDMLSALSAEGLKVAVLSVRHLITNKRAGGRPQDLLDVRALEALRPR